MCEERFHVKSKTMSFYRPDFRKFLFISKKNFVAMFLGQEIDFVQNAPVKECENISSSGRNRNQKLVLKDRQTNKPPQNKDGLRLP